MEKRKVLFRWRARHGGGDGAKRRRPKRVPSRLASWTRCLLDSSLLPRTLSREGHGSVAAPKALSVLRLNDCKADAERALRPPVETYPSTGNSAVDAVAARVGGLGQRGAARKLRTGQERRARIHPDPAVSPRGVVACVAVPLLASRVVGGASASLRRRSASGPALRSRAADLYAASSPPRATPSRSAERVPSTARAVDASGGNGRRIMDGEPRERSTSEKRHDALEMQLAARRLFATFQERMKGARPASPSRPLFRC